MISNERIHKASDRLVKVLVVKAFILILIAVFAVSVPLNNAQASTILAFGGKIVWTTYCLNGIAVTVVNKLDQSKSGQFFMVWGNQRYQYFVPKIGSSMKGTYVPGAYIPCYEGLTVLPGGFLILQWGSSAR